MSCNGRCVILHSRYIAVDCEWRKYHDRLFIQMILHSYLMIGEINILWLIANERKTIILKNNTKSYVVVVLASIFDLNLIIKRGCWGGRGGNKLGGRLLVVEGEGREIQTTFPAHTRVEACEIWTSHLLSQHPAQSTSVLFNFAVVSLMLPLVALRPQPTRGRLQRNWRQQSWIVFADISLAPPPCHVFADIFVGGCERLCSYPPPQMSSKTWQGGGAKVWIVPLISSNLSH